MSARLAAAKDTRGLVVARVFCALCPDSKAVAHTYETQHGLLHLARIDSDLELRAEFVRDFYARAHRAGVRLPYVAYGENQYLLEVPTIEQDVVPQAECPRHGLVTIDPQELLGAIRHRRSTSPAKVLIHKDA
jgi:hypothetical protein